MCKEFMYENTVFINDCYVTFNIIELDTRIGQVLYKHIFCDRKDYKKIEHGHGRISYTTFLPLCSKMAE